MVHPFCKCGTLTVRGICPKCNPVEYKKTNVVRPRIQNPPRRTFKKLKCPECPDGGLIIRIEHADIPDGNPDYYKKVEDILANWAERGFSHFCNSCAEPFHEREVA
jgi:hypothetical protein